MIYAYNEGNVDFLYSVSPQLSGCHVISSHADNDDGFIPFELRAGNDDLILLKRTAGNCRFGMSAKMRGI